MSMSRRIATKVACTVFLLAALALALARLAVPALVRAQPADVFDRVKHNYYKRNYPTTSGAELTTTAEFPKVKAPVLMFHGLADFALHRNGLAGTWDWVEKDLTLVTIPGASHFVQQDAAELVTSTMRWWLAARKR